MYRRIVDDNWGSCSGLDNFTQFIQLGEEHLLFLPDIHPSTKSLYNICSAGNHFSPFIHAHQLRKTVNIKRSVRVRQITAIVAEHYCF
ncbi:hypothetical protein D3C81_2028220 [compost metagenome]